MISVSVALKRSHLGHFHATMEGWVEVDGGVIPKAVWGVLGDISSVRPGRTLRPVGLLCFVNHTTRPYHSVWDRLALKTRGNLSAKQRNAGQTSTSSDDTHTRERQRQSLSTGTDDGGGERVRSWSGRVTVGQHTSASALPRSSLPPSLSPAQLRKRDTSVDGEVCAPSTSTGRCSPRIALGGGIWTTLSRSFERTARRSDGGAAEPEPEPESAGRTTRGGVPFQSESSLLA